jgi:SAM-dependent methyltransferase
MSRDDREHIRALYDEAGDAEWLRLERTPSGRVSHVIHQRFLACYVKSGDHVLEVGAGPGRFTFDLAALGARVDVTDISQVQLDLHRIHLEGSQAENAVLSRTILDICDTSRYLDGSFDAVIAYGGPLSYAFEQAEEALTGLFRITRPGGVVVASVMSLLGTWRYFLRGTVEDTKEWGENANDLVLETGDLRHFGAPHVCQMFRSHEIADMVSRSGATLLAMSASNWASLADEDVLLELEVDPDKWTRFLNHEVSACSESGVLDGGTHLLFAARRG